MLSPLESGTLVADFASFSTALTLPFALACSSTLSISSIFEPSEEVSLTTFFELIVLDFFTGFGTDLVVSSSDETSEESVGERDEATLEEPEPGEEKTEASESDKSEDEREEEEDREDSPALPGEEWARFFLDALLDLEDILTSESLSESLMKSSSLLSSE